MKNVVTSFIVGFIFAVGLGISGMTQPQKVVGFLDIFGNWNPSLMFVMVGAILVHAIAYRFIRRRPSPLLAADWHVPSKNEVTPSLIIGSVIFGVGWGLGGFCPGPAVTSLASFRLEPIIFVISMLIGMWLFRIFNKKYPLAK